MWATALALGATPLMASYSVANNMPNMIFELVAGGILSSLFIPTFLEVKAERGEEAAWRFASHVFNLSVLSLGVIAILGTAFPAPFIWTQTFRLTPEEAEGVRRAAEFFFRFFAIQVVVYGSGMVIQGLLNARRQYLWPALGPVFNNLVVIATMLAVYAMGVTTPTGLVLLAVGTTAGVFAMFGVMVPSLVKGGVRYTPELGLSDPAVRKMLVLAIPTVIYVTTNLVAVSFRNASAFAVAENGPSILMYAWTFYQLPYGILAVALATAVFTELSEAAGMKNAAAFKDHFRTGLRMTGVLMLPASAVLIALAEPLVSLYRVGNFEQADVAPVASVLRWWALGLVLFAAMMFVLRAFYSLKDTLTPALANVGASAVQIGLYVVLTTGIGSWAGLGINGIPITDVIFYALLLVTLIILIRRKIGGYDLKGVMSAYGRMLVASAVGGLAAFGVSFALASHVSGLSGSLLQVAAGTTVCLLVAFGLGRALGVSEVTSTTALIGRMLVRIAPRRKG
jgi:putative peptidoglycan lipid II flippase